MKKIIIIINIIVPIILTSCMVQLHNYDTVSGVYYKRIKGRTFSRIYTLQLNSDSTFFFEIRTSAGQPQCIGKWQLIDEKCIFLQCNEEKDPIKTISNAYMSDKDHTLYLLNRNRIRYKDIVLRRIE